MKIIRSAAALSLVLGLTGACSADVLGTATFTYDNEQPLYNSTTYPTVASVTDHFYFGGDGLGDSPSVDLADVVWSPSSVGSTLTVTASAPHFASAVNFLTDGTNERVGYGFTFPGGTVSAASSGPQSLYFHQSGSSGFAGDTITSISFYLQSFTWQQSIVHNSDGSIEEYGTAPEEVVIETINGTAVPEPGCIGVVAAGLVAFMRRRR